MGTTIYQIAEKAGVSPSAVSKILGGKGERFSSRTRARVEAVARRLEYRPNGSARSVRTGRFDAVGLLHSSIAQHAVIPEPFRREVERLTASGNRLLVTGQMDEGGLREPHLLPKVLREWSVDGLLLFYTHGDWTDLGSLLSDRGVPAVWVNAKTPANCVHPDDRKAGILGTEHLLSLGHRRIAYIQACGSGHYSEADRRKGYEETVIRAGLTPAVHEPGNPCEVDRTIRSFRDEAAPPSAVLCYGEGEAQAVLYAAASCGIRVPADLSVLAIHHSPATIAGWPIDTVCLPGDALAAAALKVLSEVIDGDGSEMQSPVAIAPFLHSGDSTAVPGGER